MVSHSHPSARRSAWMALCLVLCLLFAQWLGYAHAISHAGVKTEALSTQTSLSISTSYAFDHQTASNACTSLDAATLGASLHSPTFLPPLLTGAALMAEAIPQYGWLQPFTAHFSSRAPPHCH